MTYSHLLRLAAFGMAGVLMFRPLAAAQEDMLDTIAVFTGDNGAYPTSLVQTPGGDIYGVTRAGGKYGKGTIFRILLNQPMETLVHFNGKNGEEPCSQLVQAGDDVFFGTTCDGGESGKGTVYRIKTDGTFKSLASFHGPDGAHPEAKLLATADGNIYGCATEGGEHNLGVLFVVTPDGVLHTVADFGGSNGSKPQGLSVDKDGHVYGITSKGGANDYGTVFTVDPKGGIKTLYSFTGSTPVWPGNHISVLDGVMYGTTAKGGQWGMGKVFWIKPDGSEGDMASFNGTAGEYPAADLIRWNDGYFYMERLYGNIRLKANCVQWPGTNFCGVAAGGGDHGKGSVYRIAQDGTITSLVSFTGMEGSKKGAAPNSIIAGVDGNLYGTTWYGGNSDKGTIFRLQIQMWTAPSAGNGERLAQGIVRKPPLVSP